VQYAVATSPAASIPIVSWADDRWRTKRHAIPPTTSDADTTGRRQHPQAQLQHPSAAIVRHRDKRLGRGA